MSLERPRANRTRTALAEVDDLIALRLDIAELVAQGLSLRLSFLLVAHPEGLSILEITQRLLEIRARSFEPLADVDLGRRRCLDLRVPLAQTSDLLLESSRRV